jgi:hypothetical protein
MGKILCGANASNMKYYFNEDDYRLLPKAVREELKKLCVLYCADAGGIITLGFDDSHRLLISTMEPIDEIGSELKVKQMQTEHRELFEKLEKFDALVSGQEDTAG